MRMENSDRSFSTPSPASASSSSAGSWFSGIVRSGSFLSRSAGWDNSGGGRGPVNNKHQFRGVMFKYGPKPIQVAFKTGDHKRQVVFVGGLSEGFLATEYLEPLAIALDKERWSLVQFLFSSSNAGYGISSLEEDATEIDQLISYLINKEESEGVVLLGHSSGCQNIVYYLGTNALCSRAVRATILQAPISYREYRATFPGTALMIDLASKMVSEGRGLDLMPREANPESPITASRYFSLFAYNGHDDMFSSDFSEIQLRKRLGHMSKMPTLVMFSMADEYVPEHVDKKELVSRLCAAMGGAEKVEIEHGSHSLSNRVQEAVQAIIEVVKRDGPKGWDDPWSAF